MIGRPEIRTQIPAKNRAISGFFDADSKLRTRPSPALQNPVKVRVVTSKGLGEFGNIGHTGAEIFHTHNMGPVTIGCQGEPYGIFDRPAEDLPMDEIWTQRPTFQAEVKAYRLREKVRLANIAEGLGIHESTLKDYLYRKDVKPSLEVLQRAASVFGCSVTQFIDDPGGLQNGQDVSYLSDQARFFAGLILKDMAAEDLNDDDRRYLYEDHLRALERLRAIRARAASPGGADSPGPVPKVSGEPRPPRRTPRPKR